MDTLVEFRYENFLEILIFRLVTKKNRIHFVLKRLQKFCQLVLQKHIQNKFKLIFKTSQ